MTLTRIQSLSRTQNLILIQNSLISMLQKPKIALVNLCVPSVLWRPAAPQGSLALATSLHAEGVSSVIYDTATSFSEESFTWQAIAGYLSRINQRIICVSFWDSILPKAVLALKRVKELDPSRVIIVGGPSVSASGNSLLRNFPWLDFGCVGEGEKCLLELLKWLDSGQSKGPTELPSRIIFNDGNRVCAGTRDVTVLKNSEIPVLDYSLIDRYLYPRTEVLTSRGCPFSCSFCSVHLGMGSKLRFRPLDHVFAEIKLLLHTDKQNTVHLLDDNFGTDKNRFKMFCNRFRDEYPDKTWSCYFRLEDLTPANIELMGSSGCIGVFVGIESGSEKHAKRFDKGFHPVDIPGIVKCASDRFNVTASFIWGFPEETLDDLRDSLVLIDGLLDNENVFINLYQLSPMAGTEVAGRLGGSLSFNEEYISGVISDQRIAISSEEANLIRSYPDIFSSFYYQSTDLFIQKRETVFDFLGLDLDKEISHDLV